MHPTTKRELDMLAQWTLDVVQADSVVSELDEAVAGVNSPLAHAFSNDLGSLALSISGADAVRDVVPFLQAVRSVGFRRDGKAEQNDNAGPVIWTYRASSIMLRVLLFLRADSAECRYVTVGEKTVPDVRLLCGKELAEWQAKE